MQRSTFGALLVVAVACSPPPEPQPPKRPNNELVVGAFERRPPTGTQAMRFDTSGEFVVAKNKGELERTPHLGEGTYRVDGNRLTFVAVRGQCSENAGDREGTYEVVISKVGIRFVKVTDSCEVRSRLDGQTWWRIK